MRLKLSETSEELNMLNICLSVCLLLCLSVSAVLWGDHCPLAEAPLRSDGSRHVGLRGSCDLVLQAEGGCDGAAAVARHLPAAGWIQLNFIDSTLSIPAWTTQTADWSSLILLFDVFSLLLSRERPLSAASLSSADPTLSRASTSPVACLHELPAVARATEGLRPVPGVRPARPAEQHAGMTQEWGVVKHEHSESV